MDIYDRKYQIFISSTYKDLVKAREETIRVILSLYQIPIGMEMFNADNDEQWVTIEGTIDKSDYYILIIGQRYGSVTKEGISFTEKEFDYAKANGIPVLAFIRNREVSTQPNERDEDPSLIHKLDSFIAKVTANSLVDYWSSTDELGKKVSLALTKQFHKGNRVGWVRADKAASSKTLEELAFLSGENRKLKQEIEELKVGKDSLRPSIDLEMNGSVVLKLPFEKPLLKNSKLLNKLTVNDFPIEISSLYSNDDEQLLSFNLALGKNIEIVEAYNAEVLKVERVNMFNRALEISIFNNGNTKANEIYVEITFPEQILVYEKEDFVKLSMPKRPPEIPESPIKSIYNISKVFAQPAKEFRTALLSSAVTGSYTNWSKVEGQIITLKVNRLLHTRHIIFKDLLIVPLIEGNFSALVNVICEEYPEPVKFDFLIEVSDEYNGDDLLNLKNIGEQSEIAKGNSFLHDAVD